MFDLNNKKLIHPGQSGSVPPPPPGRMRRDDLGDFYFLDDITGTFVRRI
jgi:hypothetical protein